MRIDVERTAMPAPMSELRTIAYMFVHLPFNMVIQSMT